MIPLDDSIKIESQTSFISESEQSDGIGGGEGDKKIKGVRVFV